MKIDNMLFENLIMPITSTVKEVAIQLEKYRSKVLYIVDNQKLIASVSDGDIRRYTAVGGDVLQNVSNLANFNPTTCTEYSLGEAKQYFKSSEVYSIPVINFNNEIIGVVFRNGDLIWKKNDIKIPVVMMAGGKGTRLYPYTKILPKALVPIGEIPISERIIDSFRKIGCRDFYLILNHKGSMIKSYYDSIVKDYSIEYYDELKPLGTGGGLSLVKGTIKEDFILTNCDILLDVDYGKIINEHRVNNNYITMIIAKYNSVVPYGVVKVDENNDYICDIEKPKMEYLINTGVYIVSSKIIDEMESDREVGFPDIIHKYKEQGKKIGCYIINQDAYMDMGQLEELDKMKEKLNIN